MTRQFLFYSKRENKNRRTHIPKAASLTVLILTRKKYFYENNSLLLHKCWCCLMKLKSVCAPAVLKLEWRRKNKNENTFQVFMLLLCVYNIHFLPLFPTSGFLWRSTNLLYFCENVIVKMVFLPVCHTHFFINYGKWKRIGKEEAYVSLLYNISWIFIDME